MWSRERFLPNFGFCRVFTVGEKKREKYGKIRLEAFHFQCWKKLLKNMAKLGWKRFTFSAESVSLWALKVSIIFNRDAMPGRAPQSEII